MAQHEHDREDLLAEATALVERAQLKVACCDDPVVIGFRTSGAASIFFGADPVYQFNVAGELRRGYQNGRLIKAERGRLVELQRQRKGGEVQLLRSEMSAAATAEYLHACAQRIAALKHDLAAGSFEDAGQAPPDVDVLSHIKSWLDSFGASIPIAAAPHAR